MTTAYATTTVPVERSKEAIRKILIEQGAKGVQFSEDFQDHRINLRFALEVEGTLRTVNTTLVIPEPPQPKRKRAPVTHRWNSKYGRSMPVSAKRDGDRWAQAERSTYRALHYWLKSSFEAVDFGLFSMTDMFLSHFEWMIDGHATTVGQIVKPQLPVGSLMLPAPEKSGMEVVTGEIVDG
jgi:hypothetical protein